MTGSTTPLLRPDTREELQNAIAKAIHDQCCAKDLDHRDGIDHTSDWQIAAIAAECVVESRKPQWHKFDKDDESTWPENGRYWVALRNGDVSDDKFQAERTSQYRIWNAFDPRYVTHWMRIDIPVSPLVSEETAVS
jgi:hypothetical protein